MYLSLSVCEVNSCWVVIHKKDVLVAFGPVLVVEGLVFLSYVILIQNGPGTHLGLRTPVFHLNDLFLTMNDLYNLENGEFMEGHLCLWDLTMNRMFEEQVRNFLLWMFIYWKALDWLCLM